MNKITNPKTVAKRKAIAKISNDTGKTIFESVDYFNSLRKKFQRDLINKELNSIIGIEK